MTASFAYHWDQQTCQWLITSRSGHVVFESSNEDHIRRVCERLCAAHAEHHDRPRLADNHFAAVAARPQSGKARGNRICWPFSLLAVGAAIGMGSALAVADKSALTSLTTTPAHAAEIRPATAPSPVWQVEFQQRSRKVARPIWETSYQPQRQKVLRTIWETQEREETYTVTRPVVETSLRHEKYLASQPVTTYQVQYADQGSWTDQQVYQPRESVVRLKWVSGGWSTDERTGLKFWTPPMLRPTRVEQPGTYLTHRVWRPNVVTTQVPQTTYVSRVETRAVPVEKVRYVQEKRVRKVPVRVCRTVEEEEVRSVPVVTCRVVYEEQIERVPVLVRRESPASPPLESSITPQHVSERTSDSQKNVQPGPVLEQPSGPQLPAPGQSEPPPVKKRSSPLLKSFDVDRVAVSASAAS